VFKEQLQKVVDVVGDGYGAVIMGLDGIAVESYSRDQGGFDINIIVMEFSYILTQVKRASETLRVGGMQELVLKAEQLLLVVRMLNDEYFLAVALHPTGNLGKCRFLMRLIAPKLMSALQ
jgi:predicted regulator of Ras-like GTPase activity (Roadblock/LC7/MglB family)